MATASVMINFEADSVADAEAKIAAWTLHEGCNVIVNITEGVSTTTGVIDANNNLVIYVPEVPDESTG